MALTTYTNTSQTVASGGNVIFNLKNDTKSCIIEHINGTAVTTLNKPGWYLVNFTTTGSLVSTTGGTSTFHLYLNGDLIPGFEASASAIDDTVVLNFAQTSFLVRVSPNCQAVSDNCPASLTIRNDGASIILANANLTVTKLC